MAIKRIKDRWHNSTPDGPVRDIPGEKTLQDQASALSFIIWRQGLNGAINLHAEDFRYDDDQQRIGVISELLAFQIQHVDRLGYEFLGADQRQGLLERLCARVADLMQENLTDIAGPGNYRQPFIAMLNDRFGDYSALRYENATPGYETLRYLGHNVLSIMGEDQTNRWVIDQMIEIDGLDILNQVGKSLNRLFGREDAVIEKKKG